MSIRHLDALFDPASVAVFGASERPGSVGATVWRNVHARFPGPHWPVNPRHARLAEVPAFARARDLPAVPELAVICTPPASVPGLIAELGALGTHAAIVLTAGLTPTQKQAMLDAARPHLMRIVGPELPSVPAVAARGEPQRQLRPSRGRSRAGWGFDLAIGRRWCRPSLDWAARTRASAFRSSISLGEHG